MQAPVLWNLTPTPNVRSSFSGTRVRFLLSVDCMYKARPMPYNRTIYSNGSSPIPIRAGRNSDVAPYWIGQPGVSLSTMILNEELLCLSGWRTGLIFFFFSDTWKSVAGVIILIHIVQLFYSENRTQNDSMWHPTIATGPDRLANGCMMKQEKSLIATTRAAIAS